MYTRISNLIFALILGGILSQPFINTPPKDALAPTDAIQNSLHQDFNEQAWANDSIIAITNCFSYAMGLSDAGFSVPGDLKFKNRGHTPMHREYHPSINGARDVTCTKVRRLLKRDGFIRISKQEALNPSKDFNVFACYVAPHYDYHFVRKDGEYWTDKLGKRYPKRLINRDGSPWVPGEQYNSTYTHLVGFYKIPESGIDYVPL